MTSSYTSNTGIEKPATGDQSGTWGDTVNVNMDIIDRVLNGVGAISLSGTTHTITTSDGSLSDGMYRVLVLGGSPSGTNTITVSPNDQDKVFFVKNDSGQSAVFTQGSGANVTIANGDTKIIYCDGAGSGAAVVDFTNDLSMSSVSITGGTIDGTVIGGSSAAAGTFTTFTSTGIDDNATSTAITIDSSENVGIGNAAPSYLLDLYKTASTVARVRNTAATGGTPSSTHGEVVIESTDGNMGMQFLGSTTADQRILFSDTGANSGQLVYNHATNYMALYTSAAERLRITSAGNVGIGTSSPSGLFDVAGSDPAIYITNSSVASYATSRVFFKNTSAAVNIATILAQRNVATSGGILLFNTTTDAGTDTERMRIESDGGVKVVNAAYNPPTTDNDLSFDQAATNNFKCTPTGTGTLTFTNHTSGQSGNILLDNSGGHAISLAATTKGDANLATTISVAGTYWLSYYDDGTNAYVVTSAVFA